MLKVLLLLLIVVITVTSCQNSAVDKETRSPGEIAFRANCQTCHILPKATMKTNAEWPTIVARYGEKAKLSDKQKSDIIAFLISKN